MCVCIYMYVYIYIYTLANFKERGLEYVKCLHTDTIKVKVKFCVYVHHEDIWEMAA